ncbi:MAG: hypothetical protein RI996_200 [Candidatus Parcubacteria bacterium]|jgi:uncharacterized membrane protein YdjX (TVP38/TMEM64 family)
MIIEQVKTFITQDPELTALYLILAKIVGAILLFPGTPLTLLAGATLGLFWGSIVSIIGNTLGAIAAFVISRYFFRTFFEQKVYAKYPTIQKYESRFFSHGLSTVIFLRLVPLFPFNGLNYALGLTQVKLRDYAIGTFFGIIPGTIAFVYFGEALAMLNGFRIITALIAIIGLIYIGKRYEKRA